MDETLGVSFDLGRPAGGRQLLRLCPGRRRVRRALPPPLRKGTGLPVPRFAVIRADETNVRTGPATRYPITWVFKRKGMPVEIVGEYENWRKIRDWQGAGGWVHQSLLSGRRYVIVTTANAPMRKTPSAKAAEVARMGVEVIAQGKSGSGDWGRVQAGGHIGWVERRHVGRLQGRSRQLGRAI